jgi:hypothetical protein
MGQPRHLHHPADTGISRYVRLQPEWWSPDGAKQPLRLRLAVGAETRQLSGWLLIARYRKSRHRISGSVTTIAISRSR